MSRLDNNIAGKHLGKKSEYAEVYDPTLLVAVPRQPNRDNIGINESNKPWNYAYDVWNCYEISSLISTGRPFTGVGKLVYDGDSKCIVESKSLKLYLNSFNQTKMPYSNTDDCREVMKNMIETDLSSLLDTKVKINITPCSISNNPRDFDIKNYYATNRGSLISHFNIDELVVDVDKYTEDSSLLTIEDSYGGSVDDVYKSVPAKTSKYYYNIKLHTSNLFSRCQITNQPDHGDLFVSIQSADKIISTEGFVRYVSSLRGHSCFHEPTVETIYTNIWNTINPVKLFVGALYTRRGGISIAPMRASHECLLPYNVINHNIPHIKLPRE